MFPNISHWKYRLLEVISSFLGQFSMFKNITLCLVLEDLKSLEQHN